MNTIVCQRYKRFYSKLNQIEEMQEDSLFVTIDVKSLYTNISNKEGINKAVKEDYDNHSNKTVSTKVITTFLSLILTLNNIIFN